MTISNDALCGHTMIPDLIRAIPAARLVLDRYGLHGCGGTLGPAETLEFFARAHDVPLGKLLEEIRQASAAEDKTSQVAAPSEWESLADTIYRPFFRAGIGVALTLGAGWGAILLLRIAWSDSFSALSIHKANAHGHAQIFGWVGLFVMGFAYQAFPRFKHTSLAHPRLAYASFWMMLLGLVARSITQATMRWWPWLGLMGVGASGVEIAAIATMLFVVAATYRQSDRPLETYDWYIFAGLGWFLIQAIAGTAYFASTWAAPDRESLLSLVATWQPALREIQVHGFAVLMILGVSQRVFHFFYGLPRPSRTKSRAVLPVINISIMGMAAGLILMRLAGHGWAGLWYCSILILTASVAYLVLDWRIFSLPKERDRSLKFLRTAYVWLFVSLAMLVLLPVHELVILPRLAPGSDAVRIGFSHAYYGAIRHAMTVGFISFMIVGVAAKVVPTLNGIDLRRLSNLWLPYWLLLVGCTLRVTTQTLTDFTPLAFPIAGVSGVLEFTALAVWGVHLLKLMASSPAAQTAAFPSVGDARELSDAADTEVTAEMTVAAVLQRYPWLLDTFVAFGFMPLRNPMLRNTVARWTTIGQAARLLDVDLPTLLDALNEAWRETPLHTQTTSETQGMTNSNHRTQPTPGQRRYPRGVENYAECDIVLTDHGQAPMDDGVNRATT